jgi:hypothetical protein
MRIQAQAVMLLHEAVHEFGDLSDSDFDTRPNAGDGSHHLTNLIAKACFPAGAADKLLGSLTC